MSAKPFNSLKAAIADKLKPLGLKVPRFGPDS